MLLPLQLEIQKKDKKWWEMAILAEKKVDIGGEDTSVINKPEHQKMFESRLALGRPLGWGHLRGGHCQQKIGESCPVCPALRPTRWRPSASVRRRDFDAQAAGETTAMGPGGQAGARGQQQPNCSSHNGRSGGAA